jgi:hypothetical protein
MTNQDPVKTWPARYGANHVAVHESHSHHIWIASAEVRQVLPNLRSDAQLAQEHGAGFKKLDQTHRIFFSEAALRCELQYLRSHDALMFLAWVEKVLIYPATRKRDGSPALQPMAKLPRAVRALPVAQPSSGLIVRMWRGDVELRPTLVSGGFAMLAWTAIVWGLLYATVHPTHYSGSYVVRQWLAVILLIATPLGVGWWCVSVMRCALRRQMEGRSFVVSMVAFVGGLIVLFSTVTLGIDTANDWIGGWWDTVTGRLHVAEAIHDPVLGRIVVRGEIGFGSYKALERAINMKPKLTLVEVAGPGGYVYEGMEMAQLLQRNHMDTVAIDKCASACTLLLAAGGERYLGSEAKVGFHRSGIDYFKPSTAWTRTDYQIADYYRSRDAADDFIKQALDTPFNSIWYPEHGQLFTAGYATKRWDERKAGY